MKLTENSDVVKTIKRGSVYFCQLSSPTDEELKHNQYLIGKMRPCLIIGTDSLLTYPFYHAIPIRSKSENDLTNKDNLIDIRLEDDHESALDLGQTRPVHINFIKDYIGTIYDDEIISNIERKLIENYALSERTVYLEPSLVKYKDDICDLMKKVVNSITDGLKKGKNVNVQVSYLNENERVETKSPEFKIKRVANKTNKEDYKTWDEEGMRDFLMFDNLGIASLEQLNQEGYKFDSIYEIRRCIWYCKHKLSNM